MLQLQLWVQIFWKVWREFYLIYHFTIETMYFEQKDCFFLELKCGHVHFHLYSLIFCVFWKNWWSFFFQKHPKRVCLYISNQISLRDHFVFKTISRISSITSYNNHSCSFFTCWVIDEQKSCFLNMLKKHPTSGV